jgi:hypothetical protein
MHSSNWSRCIPPGDSATARCEKCQSSKRPSGRKPLPLWCRRCSSRPVVLRASLSFDPNRSSRQHPRYLAPGHQWPGWGQSLPAVRCRLEGGCRHEDHREAGPIAAARALGAFDGMGKGEQCIALAGADDARCLRSPHSQLTRNKCNFLPSPAVEQKYDRVQREGNMRFLFVAVLISFVLIVYASGLLLRVAKRRPSGAITDVLQRPPSRIRGSSRNRMRSLL